MNEQGPSVHLLKDIFSEFKDEKIVIFQKGKNPVHDSEFVTNISFSTKRVSKRNLLTRYINDFIYFHKIKDFLKNNSVDVPVYFVQSSPLAYFIVSYIKKHTKAKVVYNAQDIFPNNVIGKSKIKRLIYRPFSIMTKKLFRYADEIITISDDMKTEITKMGVNHSKISVIHNWASHYVINPDFDFKKKHNLQDKFVVLYAGNIGKFQNVKMILNAAKYTEDKEILYVIQGTGYHRKELESYASKENIKNVLFFDPDLLQNMYSTYATVDINLITLKPYVFKTALPSKLAFCLETGSALIFTIEPESKMHSILNSDSLTHLLNPNDHLGLRDFVSSIKTKPNTSVDENVRKEIIKRYFNPLVNPAKYKYTIMKTVSLKGENDNV
jgi:glycosyltransferase involved in cell wall biosynthesis